MNEAGTRSGKYLLTAAIFFGVTLIALRSVNITADPDVSLTWSGEFYSDEGWYTGNAIRHQLVGSWITDKFNPIALMPILPLAYDAAYATFGVSISVARFLTLFFTVLLYGASLTLIALGVDWKKHRQALMCTFTIILLTNYYLVIYGRVALFDLPTYSIGVSGLLVFLLGMRKQPGSIWASVGAGVVFALCALAKSSGIMFPVALVLACIFYYGLRFRLPACSEVVHVVLCIGSFSALYLCSMLVLRSLFGGVYWAEMTTYAGLLPTSIRSMIGSYLRLVKQPFLVHNAPLVMVAAASVVLVAVRSVRQKGISWADALMAGVTVGHLAVFGAVRYSPARYFVGMSVPIAYFAASAPFHVSAVFRSASLRRMMIAACGVVLLASNWWNFSSTVTYFRSPSFSMMKFAEAADKRLRAAARDGRPRLLVGELSSLAALLGLNRCDIRYTPSSLKETDLASYNVFLVTWTEKTPQAPWVQVLEMPVLKDYYTGRNVALWGMRQDESGNGKELSSGQNARP